MALKFSDNYRGYKVHFSENMDQWTCHALGYSNQSLAKVKAKIDRTCLAIRKKGAREALAPQYLGSFRAGRIIEYIGKQGKNRYDRSSHDRVGFIGDDKGGRTIEKLTDLVKPGPESDAYLSFKEAKDAEILALQNELKDALAALPRYTLEDIEDLVRVAQFNDEDDET